MSSGSPFRNILWVSGFPELNCAFWHSSSNSAMYWSMFGHRIFSFSIRSLAFSTLWESWYCASNSSKNWFHRSGMLSVAGFSPSNIVPISLTHPATSGPCMWVRVKATFFIGESNPATSWLSRRYPLIASMKSSACSLFPPKISGSFPIALMSAAARIGCCGCGAGCPPPSPPPLPPPPPPPLPPPPPPSRRRALSKWPFKAAGEVVALIVFFFEVVVAVECRSQCGLEPRSARLGTRAYVLARTLSFRYPLVPFFSDSTLTVLLAYFTTWTQWILDIPSRLAGHSPFTYRL